ncbi:MAG: hypothetical protein ACKOYN_08565 [Planctomycetota bacterium]
MTALACLVASLWSAGCTKAIQGRTWTLHDTRSEYRSTDLYYSTDFILKEKGVAAKGELFLVGGCIEVYSVVGAVDNVEVWRVYSVEDWSTNEVGVRSYDRFLISDPPRQNYMGVTDRAKPNEIPSDVRQSVGLQRVDLSVTTYPIRVQWQVTVGDDVKWISDPEDPSVVLSGAREIREESGRSFKLSLCDIELGKLRAFSAERFRIKFKLEPLDWPAESRAAAPRVLYLREPITRELIDEMLRAGAGQRSEHSTLPLPTERGEP